MREEVEFVWKRYYNVRIVRAALALEVHWTNAMASVACGICANCVCVAIDTWSVVTQVWFP